MVYRGKIGPELRAYVKFHRRIRVKHGKDSAALIKKLMKECKISKRSVYRLLNEPLLRPKKERKPAGRKRKVSVRTEHRVVRNIAKLRKTNKNWIARDLMTFTDVADVTERTFQRLLNRNGYRYRVARKKGVRTEKDTQKRLSFAKKHREVDSAFWEEDIAFFFDGVGFQYKTNPYDDATSCASKVWRQENEGLHPDCTAKGSKVGYGAKQVKFFVAISYNRGVIFAEQYEKLNGQMFAEFIRYHFPEIFRRSGKLSRIWLQDGDPSQNSKKSRDAQDEIGAILFPIPPRSPEMNPIENIFAIAKKELRVQAIESNIDRETYTDYSLRARATLLSLSVEKINIIIESYGRRLKGIIEKKGGRINY